MSRPSTDITVPSLGLPYGDKLPGGVVHIRPMTTQDEKIIAVSDPSREMQARIMDSLIGACVKIPNLTAEDLLITDGVFLIIQLRIVSYGELYTMAIECPKKDCRTRIEKTLNLSSDLPIRWASPDITEDACSVTMDSGDVVHFHHLTGKEQKRVFTEVKRLQKLSPNMKGDPTSSVSLAIRIDAVESPENGFTADDPNRFMKARAYVDGLLASEAWTIRDALDDTSSGYTMMIGEETCPRCGTSFEMEFTPSGDFFRTQRKKSRNDIERTIVSSQGW